MKNSMKNCRPPPPVLGEAKLHSNIWRLWIFVLRDGLLCVTGHGITLIRFAVGNVSFLFCNVCFTVTLYKSVLICLNFLTLFFLFLLFLWIFYFMNNEEMPIQRDVRCITQTTEQALVSGAICLVPRYVFLKFSLSGCGESTFCTLPMCLQFFCRGILRFCCSNFHFFQAICRYPLWSFCLPKKEGLSEYGFIVLLCTVKLLNQAIRSTQLTQRDCITLFLPSKIRSTAQCMPVNIEH